MRIGNVYNLESIKALLDSAKAKGFQDSYTGVVLAHALTAINPRIFEKKYPGLAFLTSGIEVDNTGGYARQIESLRIREQGGFTTSGDESGNKGRISLAGENNLLKVLEREGHTLWNDTDARRAELQGVNLVSQFLSAHNKLYQREIDEAGYLGVPDIATSTGLLNTAAFTSVAATGAIGTLTAQQMYDDIAGLITAQHNAVNNTPEYMAVKVDMPNYVLNTLGVTILNTAAGSASVLSALKANFPGVEFRGTHRADNAGGAGVSHTVAYSNNPEVMQMRIPVPLTISEIVKVSGFDYRVDSKYSIGGLDILESTGGYILIGL